MNHRDEHGIICQNEKNQMDGGDSAFSTSLMAWAGSQIDSDLLLSFTTDSGELVRHPYQPEWNKPELTSRDQLIAFAAGIPTRKNNLLGKLIFKSHATKWFINSDILTPEVKLYLYKCCGVDAPFLLKASGYLFAGARLLWDTKIKPNHEMNQSIVLFATLGAQWLRLLNKWHPDLDANVKEYFCNWRAKPEMYEAISKKIKDVCNG